jgi:hypothetical protein
VDTCQAAIDSILTIYTGNEPNALGRVAENNNGCPNNPDGTTNFGSKVAERSVWYRWTAPFSGSARLDTCTTNFDTLLSVSPGSFGLIATNNNHPDCPQDTFGSKLSFDALRGQTYYIIAVDGCCGAPQGTFTLALDLVGDVAPNTRIIGARTRDRLPRIPR